MSNHEYGVQLRTVDKRPAVIHFERLRDRELFLSLLNKSRMNSHIFLFEENQQEEDINE